MLNALKIQAAESALKAALCNFVAIQDHVDSSISTLFVTFLANEDEVDISYEFHLRGIPLNGGSL